MGIFIVGASLGGALTYAWLLWHCNRAVVQFRKNLIEEIDRH